MKALKTKQPKPDSRTRVYPSTKKGCLGVDRLVDVDGKRVFGKETVLTSKKSRRHGVGIWNNRRVTMSFRVDEGLKKRFLPFTKRVFGSVCLPMESFMAGILSTVVESEKLGVYPSTTVPLKLDIGKIIIKRNLRPRRKLELAEEVDDTILVVPKCGLCGKSPVVARFKHLESGIEEDVCDYHAKVLRERFDWTEVTSHE